MSTHLDFDVFITDLIPQHTTDVDPNGNRLMWSPLSSTLIYGERDAVLVDAPLIRDQSDALADWIQASRKNLTHIYVTHGHGDHWFTAGILADKFSAQIVATAGTIEQMHGNVAIREALWDKLFPGQIPETTVTAAPLENNLIEVEGHPLYAVEVGHTDSDATTVLHVPDLDLVVSGDAIYNGVHQYLGESGDGGRDKWRAAIDIVESLRPRWIVAGHKNKDLDNDAVRTIAETRDYLDLADELLQRHSTPVDFFNAMVERFPDRLNPAVAWMNAVVLCR
jgi:glyoxylase-like metal-dependent hydrolase (beta-lactamase superfamily II)